MCAYLHRSVGHISAHNRAIKLDTVTVNPIAGFAKVVHVGSSHVAATHSSLNMSRAQSAALTCTLRPLGILRTSHQCASGFVRKS